MQKLLQDVHIGVNLRILRKERKMSQGDVVLKLQLYGRKMSRANYAHIERGDRNIYVSDLILLREIFNVSFDRFFSNIEVVIPEVDEEADLD